MVDDEDFELDTTMGPFSTIDEKGEDRKDDADTSVYIDTAEELSDPDSALASHDSNFQLRETAVVFDERDTSPVIEAEGDFEVVAEVMQSWAVPEDKTALGIEGEENIVVTETIQTTEEADAGSSCVTYEERNHVASNRIGVKTYS